MESKWNSFLEKWKGNRKLPGKNQLLLLFLTGLLLLVIVLPTPTSQKKEEDMQNPADVSKADTAAAGYEEYLEKRVASALEYVEGVGRTEVVITLKSSGEKVVEKDSDRTTQTITEKDSAGGERNSQERTTNTKSIFEQQSNGSQTPYVSKELTPEIEGVVVIADGGDSPVVIQNITEAVQALFGVEAHKIKIMKRTAT